MERVMITFKGSPEDGGLYTGYNVICDGQIIGFIGVGGFFRSNVKVLLTKEEQDAVVSACKRVYEMPSEYGCLGVGESPNEPFDEDGCRATIAA